MWAFFIDVFFVINAIEKIVVGQWRD